MQSWLNEKIILITLFSLCFPPVYLPATPASPQTQQQLKIYVVIEINDMILVTQQEVIYFFCFSKNTLFGNSLTKAK